MNTDEKLQEMDDKLDQIHKAVIGDQSIGLTGLVKRTERLERWVRRADVRIAMFSGGAISVWFIIDKLILR